ncbi:plexin domain-containing protein 1-like [Tigriopus californicus]|nr:plexin domain-containing protein 1-like [Tigriopus californicus]
MSGSQVHDFLSNHSQAAEAVAPGFDFPFYGHMVDQFFITTHGFLSFAPRLHNLMYKTQYIAPLRVKLDPSLSDAATINYLAKPDSLTIQWTNVTIAKPYAHPHGGNFTFQITLHKNGNINFVYIEVPELLTADALYDHEPVAGLSDAFLIGDSELHVYHTLNLDNTDINSKTVVLFKAKPTCIQQQSCEECSSLRQSTEFECTWCSSIHRCSDGADRLREHWNTNECANRNVSTVLECTAAAKDDEHHTEWRTSMGDKSNQVIPEREPIRSNLEDEGSSSTVTVISTVVSALLLAILLIILAGFLYVYGKSNPGGLAERIALRLESNYNRFGKDSSLDEDHVELGVKPGNNNNNSVKPTVNPNNNNLSVNF